jgi:pimeloyl-ACP methyl ester carboxylesterase
MATLLRASLIFLVACGGGGGSPDAGADGAAAPDAESAPDADVGPTRIEPAACRFEVDAELELAEGTDYECGDLIVPENRLDPTTNIKVHFIRFFAGGAQTTARIYLDGGPGGSGQGIVNYLAYLGTPFLAALLSGGDFLVIGQRGTELSVPYLQCDEVDCEEIAHLPSYNTAFNADDVNDLRAALGYDSLDVYGISYGSRLGLEVLRRHGDHVRAAVVDGLVPSQINWPAHIPASFHSALTGLNASCAEQIACQTAFGDLAADFETGVLELQDDPVTISWMGDTTELDGWTYSQLLFQVMYSQSTYPRLPLLISDLAERRTDRINDFVGQLLAWAGQDRGISTGLYYSVICGELFNPPDQNAFADANQGVPQLIQDLYSGSWYNDLDLCPQWPVGDLQDELSMPVTSSVPTLVGSGRMDPITPPSFGALAASTITGSVNLVFEGSGHGATLQSQCGRDTFLGFLADPSAAIDGSCAAALTVDYEIPSSAAPSAPLPMKRVGAELDMAPIPPDMARRLRDRIRAQRRL